MKKKNNYHGFLALPRQTKLLMKDLGLNLYGFYVALAMEAIWDRKNPDIGRVVKKQIELAFSTGCNQSTISRLLKDLEKRKYLIRHKDYIFLAYFPLFLNDVARKMYGKDYANLQELYADMYKINAELQQSYAISQHNRGQMSSQSLYISSNDNLSFSQNNAPEDFNYDEIDRRINQARRDEG